MCPWIRAPGEGEIADHVADLVAQELVGISQPALVHDPVVVEDHRIVERGAEGEPALP